VASSLIPINQATVKELQALRGIGPKRAGRIVRYREEVSSINNVYELATAAGMGVKQANSLSTSIEWHETQFKAATLLVPSLTFAGSYLLVFFGFSELRFDFRLPSTVLYNLSLLLIMIGCVFATFEQFMLFVNQRRMASRFLTIISATSFLLGIASMISLVTLNLVIDLSPAFAEKSTATTNFLLFVFIIAFLLYAPGIHLKLINLFKSSNARTLDIAAAVFDTGQVIFAILTLLILAKLNSGLWVEEIFAIWASVMFVSNGVDMLQGRSAYVSLLSLQEKEILRFVLAENNANDSFNFSHSFMKTTGVGLVIIGVVIIGFALYGLLA
jgi:competence ComEA-like helix-hairpin-helix protein